MDRVYLANYLGRNMRLYRLHYRSYLDEDRYFWEDVVIVDFVDLDGFSMGELPRTPNASELLKVIQFQNPLLANFYNDLLG
ncbi:hypothetical protein I5T99_16050 [Stenotrophomonas maltophilia]|nr:hypothetical protein [Stenotrophomonas maltophilia]